MKIVHNAELASKLRRLIDATDLATVKAYLRDPQSEIDRVALVQGDHLLEEVAAVFVAGDTETYMLVAQEGGVKLGVDSLNEVRTEFQDCVVVLDTFPDNQLCDVIYLPPFYLVKIRPGRKWE